MTLDIVSVFCTSAKPGKLLHLNEFTITDTDKQMNTGRDLTTPPYVAALRAIGDGDHPLFGLPRLRVGIDLRVQFGHHLLPLLDGLRRVSVHVATAADACRRLPLAHRVVIWDVIRRHQS